MESIICKPKILLFGRTGSGKSSIANMLASSHLNEPLKFRTSSGVRGETISIQREECESMVIVDTIGLGESDKGSISDAEARSTLFDFFAHMEEGYNYFAFVRKWGKIDFLDESLWQFFTLAFRGAERNFVIIFTHCKPEWLDDPKTVEDIRKIYGQCNRWISVDFPASKAKGTMITELRNKKLRANSLTRLQKKLEEFLQPSLAPSVCEHMRKGRVLLVGRRAAAKNMIANLLVKGDLRCQPLPFHPNSVVSPYLEAKGRRWEVVDATALELYNLSTHNQVAHHIITAITNRAYSHVLYIEEGGQNDKVDKCLWEVLSVLFAGVKEKLVLLIALDGKPARMEKDGQLQKRLNASKTVLQLEFPRQNHPEEESIHRRRNQSLRVLEDVLEQMGDSLVKLELSVQDEQVLVQELGKFFAPLVDGMRARPQLRWIKEIDPLSELSKMYRKICSEKRISHKLDSSKMYRRIFSEKFGPDKPSGSSSTLGTDQNRSSFCETGEFVAVKEEEVCRYLGVRNSFEALQRIHVRVESQNQGWSKRVNDLKESVVFELGVLNLQGSDEEEVGSRSILYRSLHTDCEWQTHECNVTDDLFLRGIKHNYVIMLFLRSQAGYTNYTRYASMELFEAWECHGGHVAECDSDMRPKTMRTTPTFCETHQLVAGQHFECRYLEMICSVQGLQRIDVTVQSHEAGPTPHQETTEESTSCRSWGELAVFKVKGSQEVEVGWERFTVYRNLQAGNSKWPIHECSITDEAFLRQIKQNYIIALFLRSISPGINYTRYASLQLS